MGSYGSGPFDNDGAFDFVGALVRKRTPSAGWKFLRDAVQQVEPFAGYGVEELVATGEIVSWVKGRGKHLPSEHPTFESWLKKQGKRVPAGFSAALDEKLKAVAKLGTSPAWRKNVLDIARRARGK